MEHKYRGNIVSNRISYMSLMAKVRPCREGGNEEGGVGDIVNFSMKAPKSLSLAIDAVPVLTR